MHKGINYPGRIQTTLRVVFALVIILSIFSFVQTVSAEGMTQISGDAYAGAVGDFGCDDSEGAGADFINKMEGDLKGCLYVFVESYHCQPSGTYFERGHEIYVGGGDEGDSGTFETTYLFSSKYEDCNTFDGPIFGRCQHPIVEGSGTGDYEGVRGRLHLKDDPEAGVIHYTGHMK